MKPESFDRVEVLSASRARLGEGPIWDDRKQVLYWVDIYNHRIHQFDSSVGRDEWFDVGDAVTCVALTHSDELLITLRHRLALLDVRSKAIKVLREFETVGNSGHRLNDGKCDSQGRFWFGSMSRGRGEGELYRYDPDGSLRVMESGVSISNGLGWSPDQKTFYYTDSPLRTIYAYDYEADTGAIGNKRIFVDLSRERCYPDGLAVDAEGHVWSAQWDGWRVIRFAPNGEISGQIEVPVQRPTSCAFGGPDFASLFITSASVGLSEEQIENNFHAGDLLAVRTRVGGLPANRFNS